MNNLRHIGRLTPYLRRYGRALTGSQPDGDAVVQQVLDSILVGRIRLEADRSPRLALYRAFHTLWSSRVLDQGSSGPQPTAADDRLQRLTPDQRAVLLLVVMEGFSTSDAAEVLGIPAGDARDLLAAAQREVEQQLATGVLIVEDEPIVALDLERLASELGHRIVGIAATRAEAVQLAHTEMPGLVLADVRLADGSSGADAAAEILTSFDVPVIFITAYPESLLTGTRNEPVFLLTKPFAEDAVKAMIGQALFFHQSSG